jgi:hypothetical protein
MLQCNNYKARKVAFARQRAGFHTTFTKNGTLPLPRPTSDVICPMAYSAHARDLRNLLSVAAKLRRLAADTWSDRDQLLFLMAAEALEKRAAWLQGALPDDHHDKDPDDLPYLHKPIDLII